MNIKSKDKKITQYEQTKPEQLTLFELLDPAMEKYSNTVELYDIMPKFYFGGVQREKGKLTESLPILKREFKHREKPYNLNIKPAAIENKEGKTIHYYPGQREELVEDVIRKLATRQKAVFLDDKDVAVKFTLYEVEKELRKMGHGYNLNEIKEAIQVCNNASIEIKSQEGNEVSISSNIFPSVFMETKEMEGGKNKVVVILHPLITKSINEGSYRLINYEKLMKLKMPLSRWIHRRISHLFSQATIHNPYRIKISTIIRDSGMKEYKTMSERVRQVVKSMEELKKIGTISRYEKENVMEKNKILDVFFYLYVSEEFVADIKKANKVANLRHNKQERIEENFDVSIVNEKISDPIFGLTKTIINNIVQKIRSKDECDDILQSLDAAKNYILQLKEQGKRVTAGAITQKALREGWILPEGEGVDKKSDSQIEEKVIEEISKRQQKEKKRLKNISLIEKEWDKILKKIEKKIGKEDFSKWFDEIELYDFVEGAVVINTTKFKRDWIVRSWMDDILEAAGCDIKFVAVDK